MRISSRAALSTPCFSASVIASASDSITDRIRKLPLSLTTLAADGVSPMVKLRWPIASNSGAQAASAAGGPAATTNSFAAAAAAGRPKTGAAS